MVKIEWHNYLNESQFQAVSSTTGPMVVVAGAGSGKTRVLTYRIAYLIQEHKVPPESIMAITFTNKAANEMKERTINLCGRSRFHPWVGTFHRTCSQILRSYSKNAGLPDIFTVFDDSEQVVVIKRILKRLNIDHKEHPPKNYIYRISKAKSHLITPEEFAEDAHSSIEEETAKIYKQYDKELRSQNAYDFDDLIMQTCLLLENHKPTRDALRMSFRYVLVDEFQDINPAQYELIKYLTNPETRNIFVVGDDDQAIYGWRYADPAFIDKFKKDFHPVQIVKLEDNYRSTKQILDVANEVIKNKSWGIQKTLRSHKFTGEMPQFNQAQSDTDEAYYIAQKIKEMVDCGADYSDFAILYRINALSRSFEETFGRFSIPYQVVGGLKFYQRMEIKDILGYFRVLVNDKDRASLKRIINTPKRGIGDKAQECIFQLIEKHNIGLYEVAENMADLCYELPDSAARKFQPFLSLMVEFKKQSEILNHVELLEWILDKSGYEKQYKNERTIESQARLDNLNELKGAFAGFQDEYPGEGIDRYIEQISLMSDLDNYETLINSITLMSLHSAKGLEFKYVFLPSLEEKILPHARSFDSQHEMEEERRLLYVGITRAKDLLFMSCANRRYTHGLSVENEPSHFLKDIPENLVENLYQIYERQVSSFSGSLDISESYRHRRKKKIVSFDEYSDYSPMPSDEEVVKVRTRREETPLSIVPSDFKVGDKISHPKFGIGEIVQIHPKNDDNFISIVFEKEIGIKILSEKIAPLTKFDE